MDQTLITWPLLLVRKSSYIERQSCAEVKIKNLSRKERTDFREQLESFHPGHKVFFFIGFHYTLQFFFPYSQQWCYFFWIRVGREKARVCWCPMREIPVVMLSWVPWWSPQWDSLISACYNGCCLLQLAVNNSTSGLHLWQSTPQ